MTKGLLFAAVLLCPASAVAAQAPQAPKPVSRTDYVKALDTRFNGIDTSHDGKISKEEFDAEMQRQLQQARARIAQQLETRFHQLDTNKDGQLSLQEFLAIEPPLRPTETTDQVIQRLDTNHDGKIGADEFRAPELAKFNRLDANHDGVVTPDEIRAAQGQR